MTLKNSLIEYINFFIDIIDVILTYPNISRSYKLSNKKTFDLVQPGFKRIITHYESISNDTRELFGLKIKVHRSEGKFIGIKRIEFQSKPFNFYIFYDYKRILWINLRKELLQIKNNIGEKIDKSQLDNILLRIQFFFTIYLTSFPEYKSFITTYQLILEYMNNYESIFASINPHLLVYYQFMKSHQNYDQIKKDYSQNLIENYLEDLKEYSQKEKNEGLELIGFLKHLKTKYNKQKIQVFSKNVASLFEINPIYKNDIDFNYFFRNLKRKKSHIFLSNHPQFNIQYMGIKCFLYEFTYPVKIPEKIPPYILEIADFDTLSLFLLCSSSRYTNRIRKPFERVLNIRYSRSLGSYILKNFLSFDIEKKVGIFPSAERILRFKDSKNHFKYYRKLFSQKEAIEGIKSWYTFTGLPFQFDFLNKEEKDSVLTRLKNEQKTFDKYDRKFFTNIPMNTPLIAHQRNLLVYIKFYENKSNLFQKMIKIRDFIEVWADRAIFVETKNSFLANIRIFDHEEYFMNRLKTITEFHEINCVILSRIIDFSNKQTLVNRYRNQFLLPPFDTFNPKSYEFEIPFPKISDIKRDFSSQS